MIIHYITIDTYTPLHTHTGITIRYIHYQRGVRCVTDSVVGNGHGDTCSNPIYISYTANTLGESMNPIVLPPAMGRSYLPTPSARAGYDTRSIFKRSLTGLNSEFYFS